MKLRICLLLTLCVVGIAGQSSTGVSPSTAATPEAPTTAAPITTAAAVASSSTLGSSTVAPPTSTAPTTPPTSTAPTTPPTSAAPTSPPTSAAPTSPPTSAAPSPPTSDVPTGPPTSEVPTGPPTAAASTVSPTAAASTVSPTSAAPTAPPTSAAPTAPPTSAAPATTTTPAPKAVKMSSVVTKNGTDLVCLKMEGTIYFTLEYMRTGDKDSTKHIEYIPSDANYTDSVEECATEHNETQFLSLTWSGCYNATFAFAYNPDDAEYGLQWTELEYNLTNECFPGVVVETENETRIINGSMTSDGDYTKMAVKQSYRCDTTITTDLFTSDTNSTFDTNYYNGSVVLSGMRFMAFQDGSVKTDSDYSTAVECSKDFTTSDIVPIAVGCALAALVVIVLIAYLIGRRRSRQKGYQSV